MKTVTIADSSFVEVRLSALVPNKERDLEHYPLIPDVVKMLKTSIHEIGLRSNVCVFFNEDKQYELFYGHHRIEAAKQVLGEKTKVCLQLATDVPEDVIGRRFRRINELNRENNARKDSLQHNFEMVERAMHFFDDYDDGVFEICETREKFMAYKNICHKLGGSFTNSKGKPSERSYQRARTEGVGNEIIASWLEININVVNEALASLEPTPRRARYLKKKAEEDQEKVRQLANELAEERAEEQREEKKKKAEEAEKQAAESARKVEIKEWYDPAASRVFDRAAHSKAFRQAVEDEKIQPFLSTDQLVPFAKAIKNSTGKGQEVTADFIGRAVENQYKHFAEHMSLMAAEVEQKKDDLDPMRPLIRQVDACINAFKNAREELGTLQAELAKDSIVGAKLGAKGDKFTQEFGKLEDALDSYKAYVKKVA